jgi:hypothetical protein
MSVGAVREQRAVSPAPTEAPTASEPSAPASLPGSSVFARVIEGLGQEVRRGESLVRTALGASRGGRDIGPAELIALQAGVYRYGEAVDLASRLIDRTTSSVKTVLQGQ